MTHPSTDGLGFAVILSGTTTVDDAAEVTS
jgi:hypothetical protein